MLIPPFQAPDDVIALVERLPKLRLVQLLSAGADRWIGRLPEGVGLSDGRGSHGGATGGPPSSPAPSSLSCQSRGPESGNEAHPLTSRASAAAAITRRTRPTTSPG